MEFESMDILGGEVVVLNMPKEFVHIDEGNITTDHSVFPLASTQTERHIFIVLYEAGQLK